MNLFSLLKNGLTNVIQKILPKAKSPTTSLLQQNQQQLQPTTNKFHNPNYYDQSARTPITVPAPTGFGKAYIYGTIITGYYKGYKRDPYPVIFVLFSGMAVKRRRPNAMGVAQKIHYTIGFNLNSLMPFDRDRLLGLIYRLAHSFLIINGYNLYYKIVNEIPGCKNAIRTYFTSSLDASTISKGMFRSLLPIQIKPTNVMYVNKLNQMMLNKQNEEENTGD